MLASLPEGTDNSRARDEGKTLPSAQLHDLAPHLGFIGKDQYPYAPCMEYLPSFTPFLWPSYVGKYTIHGAYGIETWKLTQQISLGQSRRCV